MRDDPSSFPGYLYEGKVYYKNRPTISPDGFVIWPKPMGVCINPVEKMEGLFEACIVSKNKVSLKLTFLRIK